MPTPAPIARLMSSIIEAGYSQFNPINAAINKVLEDFEASIIEGFVIVVMVKNCALDNLVNAIVFIRTLVSLLTSFKGIFY